MASHVISQWNPEDKASWDASGRSVAQRNLWLSIPALTLAFAVWMVWSVVVVNLPGVGFKYSTNQLFWLAALPALATHSEHLDAEVYEVLSQRSWLESKRSQGGTALPRVREQLVLARERLAG